MTFKFKLGDHVVRKGHLETELKELAVQDVTPRLDTMTILERVSHECVGGIQLFYICETWDGRMARFAEVSLITSHDAFDQWGDAFMAQQTRLDAKRKEAQKL